jgi:hypothetical protein
MTRPPSVTTRRPPAWITFESWQHGIHVWPVYVAAGLPEAAQAIEHLAVFLKTHSHEAPS